jgi:hypothetical protein
VSDWTRDGRSLIAVDLRGATQAGATSGQRLGVYLVPLDGGDARKIVDAPGEQWGGVLDPSGRFLAYTSTETGTDEVFVTSMNGTGKWQVSSDGGQMPVWTRDGRTVLYARGDAIFAVDVATDDGFRAGIPREFRRGSFLLRTAPFRNFDVGPGNRLAVISRRTDLLAARQLEVLVGWEAKLASDATK